MSQEIVVNAVVGRDMDTVWSLWNSPEHIQRWMHASNDWECTKAVNNLKVGGRFSFTLAAKNKSASFDFSGTYTAVELNKVIAFALYDKRTVSVLFDAKEDGVHIIETFEMENENPEEMQRVGWQAILDSFKNYCES